jgi:iron complex outermembrane receptor protein
MFGLVANSLSGHLAVGPAVAGLHVIRTEAKRTPHMRPPRSRLHLDAARSAGWLAGVALWLSVAGFVPVGRAQTGASPVAADEVTKLGQFVVTGSNIPTTETADEARLFPVLSLNRRAIEQTGLQSMAELLQDQSISNGGAVPVSNNGTGYTPSASSASIHALGPDAALVLVNGHRMANYPLGQGTVAFVDLNTIPLAAVERVEVLKDGASAVYGADAVAGVINIILRNNADGTAVSLRYGNTTSTDSSEYNAGVFTGARSRHGSIAVALSYDHRAAIYHRDRPYSANAYRPSLFSSPISAQITRAAYDEALSLPAGTSPPGVSRPVFYATPGVTPGAPGGNTVPADGNAVANSTNFGTTPANQYIFSPGPVSRYNYNQAAMTFPDFTRYGAVISGEYRFGDVPALTAYFDLSLQRNLTLNVLAPFPSGIFSTPGATELVIPARTPNPLPLPDGRARAAPAGAFNPFNPFNVDITGSSRYRFVDFGLRIERDTNDAAMFTAGLRTDNFHGTWNADGGVRYSQIIDRTNYTQISVSRLNRVLNQADSLFNPASPDYLGTTTAYNPFGYYTNPIPSNAKVIDYVSVNARSRYFSWLGNAFFSVNNPSLLALPAGDLGVAAGLDFRRESLTQEPDELSLTGDVVGLSATPFTNSSRNVLAVYAEARAPLLSPAQSVPGAYELVLDVAVRNEAFLTNHHDKVLPKIGLRWAPWSDTFSVRASFGTGIRQPSLYELYVSNEQGIELFTDPRDGSDIEAPFLITRNPALRLETTNSLTVGAVWSPKGSGRGFTIAADAWRVECNGTVGVDPQNTLDRFFGTAPGGTQPGEEVLLGTDGSVLQVTSLYLNRGKTTAQGLDLSASYRLRTRSAGRFDLSMRASYLDSIRIGRLPGVPTTEMVDLAIDESASDGYLRWKGSTNATWTSSRFTVSLTGRYTGGFEAPVDLSGNPYRVASTWIYDAQVSCTLDPWLGRMFHDSKLVLGGRNITDVRPPTAYNTTGYPGFLYTAEGRFVYASLEKKF